MATDKRILEYRARIDAIDDELLALVNERAETARQVGRIKQQAGDGESFYRPEREAQILRRIQETNPGPLPSAALARLWQEMMSLCLSMERALRIAYLGPEGTYTHAAALKHFGSAVTGVPLASIEEVVRDVEAGSSDYAVLPLENSLEGSVNQTLDCLSESSLKICGEVVLGVHHQFLSRTEHFAGVRRIYAHEHALAQCRRWLDAHVPGVARIGLASNALAAQRAAQEADSAAIAGEYAAALYALPIRYRNIEDHPQNTTRFVVLGAADPAASGDDLTSLMFILRNRPGALYEVLQTLAEAGISMTRIESRPMRQGTWEYLFFVDIEGHREDAAVAAAVERIAAQTTVLKVLGSYPRAAL